MGPCLRNCLQYSITIQPDFTYSYTNLENKTFYKDVLTLEEKESLMNCLERLSHSKIKDLYGTQKIRDLQQIKLNINNKEVQIYGKRFASAELKELLEWVNKLLKDDIK